MIQVQNNDGGVVNIINPPYIPHPQYESKENTKKRWWKRSFRIAHRWYITFSNCRVKKRPTDGYTCTSRMNDILREIKQYRYKQAKGHCPMCGKEYDIQKMELHHILPWGRFPELRGRKANMQIYCHSCHKEIHMNPWLNIRLMKQKAAELGIDLKDRYDYGDEDCPQESAG